MLLKDNWATAWEQTSYNGDIGRKMSHLVRPQHMRLFRWPPGRDSYDADLGPGILQHVARDHRILMPRQ